MWWKDAVPVAIDGESIDIECSNIKTEIPILSVRRMVRKKNRVMAEEESGEIVNLKTGKKIPFFEQGSVYFLKVEILPFLPDPNMKPAKLQVLPGPVVETLWVMCPAHWPDKSATLLR